jgi:hypothetical protein
LQPSESIVLSLVLAVCLKIVIKSSKASEW